MLAFSRHSAAALGLAFRPAGHAACHRGSDLLSGLLQTAPVGCRSVGRGQTSWILHQPRQQAAQPEAGSGALAGAGGARGGGGGGGRCALVTGDALQLCPITNCSPPSCMQGRHPQTVYTLRVHTGLKRGSALDDYNAGVLVCLVGSDGAAYLARLQPLADPESREQELLQVCSSLDGDSDAGANCRLVLHSIGKQRKAGSGSSSSSAALAVKRRFQEGSVDEICFVGPELGPLAGMLIAPEAGRWVLDEVGGWGVG